MFGARNKRARVDELTICKKCGKEHAGECRLGSNLCFKCGKIGHYSLECPQHFKCYNCGDAGHLSRECPKPKIGETGKVKSTEKKDERPRAKTRVYALTQDQARVDPDIVSAQILCKRKIIRLKAPYGSEVEVLGERNDPMPSIISMIKAADNMRRGCKAYLVYVIDKCKEVKELDDVPMVREYPEVFPEDLPGIPPDREIEFRIDLVPYVQPWLRLHID
ncbi:hypothetical protein L1987_30291 [Smallanthus sonchifolius]|uniref:Uncharacterized protein n=1 Tax=Smallanthus sonchifolius TaxID=185202 RepID=A0ACB9I278_9ASTR|nr:hypothetical protein L1987_30291 [Smallanthus sonchifolius]